MSTTPSRKGNVEESYQAEDSVDDARLANPIRTAWPRSLTAAFRIQRYPTNDRASTGPFNDLAGLDLFWIGGSDVDFAHHGPWMDRDC